MRYLVTCKLDSPFLTDWLLFPAWERDGGDVVCIYDFPTKKYIMAGHWENENDEPRWQEVEEDHL